MATVKGLKKQHLRNLGDEVVFIVFPYGHPVIFSDDLECPITSEMNSISVPLLFSEGDWIP